MKKNILNVLSLAGIQGGNALLPIVVFPFLLSTLGAEKYSAIVIGESVSLIILTLVLYSYEVNGVTLIVKNKNSGHQSLSKIFSEIFFARMGIWFLCTLAASIYTYFFAPSIFAVILSWSLVPLGYILQSSYLFQGLENNLPVAAFTMIARVLCVTVILLFGNSQWPEYHPPMIIGGSYLLTGLFSFIFAHFALKIRLQRVLITDVRENLKSGFSIFLGNLAVVFFRDSNVLILGMLGLPASSVASYSIAEKLVKSLQATMRPLNQFFYPKVVRDLHSGQLPSRETLRIIFDRTKPQLIIVTSVMLAVLMGWSIFGKAYLLPKIKIPDFDYVLILVAIMFPATLFGIMNFMFGTTGLNNLKNSGFYAKALIITGGISLMTGLLLIHLYGSLGAATNFIVGEVILLVFVISKFTFFSTEKKSLA